MPQRNPARAVISLGRLALAAGSLGSVLLGASPSRAANPDCVSLAQNPDGGAPTVIYVAGSTAAKGIIKQVASVLRGATSPVLVVYQGLGSCSGVQSVAGAVNPLTATDSSGKATPGSYWDASGNEFACDFTTAATADVGVSDVFAESCGTFPNGVGENINSLQGPIQAMTFTVPNASTQKSISAEAAYMVFGFGANSGVAPWTDSNFLYVRSASSGTQQMIAAAIGVPATRWFGKAEAGSGNVLSDLIAANSSTTAGVAEKAIGILGADVADAENNKLYVHQLAYQHYGQSCGFIPDSAPNRHDKRNVRDGHYAIWGPIHLYQRKDRPNQAASKLFVDYLTGAQDPPTVDLIAFEAAARVIPQCAMRVKRDAEMGAPKAYTPPKPCGCYYEYIANTATTCAPCKKAADCPSGYTCPLYANDTVGFCEAP